MINVEIRKKEISGKVKIDGAKNSALKLLVATILYDGKIKLFNVPTKMIDVDTQIELLKIIGKKVHLRNSVLTIDGSISTSQINQNVSIRSTILMAGILFLKFGFSKVPFPGGCKIGERGIDLHLEIFKSFGAKIKNDENFIILDKDENYLDSFPSVINLSIRSTGATENAILMGCLANKTFKILNPHLRPEIDDLISFLRKLGYKIQVNGSLFIEILPSKVFYSGKIIKHKVISDSMEALTYLVLGMLSASKLKIINFPFNQLEIPMIFLKHIGLNILKIGKNFIVVKKSKMIYPFEISTGTYPGINSDMQPLFSSLAINSNGKSTIVDLRFPDRFNYLVELIKFNGNYNLNSNKVTIFGSNTYSTTSSKVIEVVATDLRGGASLLVLSSTNSGTTIIKNFDQVMRGYSNVIEKMKKIGMNIYELHN